MPTNYSRRKHDAGQEHGESTVAVGFTASGFSSDAVVDVLLRELPVGVLVVDRNARILYANEAAQGFRLRATGTRDDRDSALVAAIEDALARTLLTGEVIRDEVIETRSTCGERCWCSLNVSPVPAWSNGAAAVVMITDRTAREQRDAWKPLLDSLARL